MVDMGRQIGNLNLENCEVFQIFPKMKKIFWLSSNDYVYWQITLSQIFV